MVFFVAIVQGLAHIQYVGKDKKLVETVCMREVVGDVIQSVVERSNEQKHA